MWNFKWVHMLCNNNVLVEALKENTLYEEYIESIFFGKRGDLNYIRCWGVKST